MSARIQVVCSECGTQFEFKIGAAACPNCKSPWAEARYDYDALAKSLPEALNRRPFNLWRYRELLPVKGALPEVSMGEGGTPLIKSNNLGLMLGCSNLYVKDERQGPTASFKDRQAAVTITALKEAGVTDFIIASTGNVAISYSAFAARASIKLWAFLTSLVPAAKMREVALYGTQVVKVTGSYDQAKQVAAQFAAHKGILLDTGAKLVPCIESMKTIAFEIAEQLAIAEQQDPTAAPEPRFKAPDWYIQSVSGGMGPIGVLKGFEEMVRMGWTDKVPKVAAIQAEGCSPMANAWKQNLEQAQPVKTPRTMIATLATGDPGATYTVLRKKMLANNGGIIESVTDEEAFRAMHFVAKMEGLSVEPAAAVAFAGLVKLVRAGVIKPDETVVVNCTGHTMPIERNILGEGWAKNLVMPDASMENQQEDGLLAALSKISTDRFPRIAIVDDTVEVRQLIRRILQSQGSDYTIFEACDGREAINLINKEHPDLIILDLMMPEMDGFAVMNALQNNPQTANIPIIVVTAKELTPAEKKQLSGHIQGLMQKGDFMSDELLDEVRALLR